MKSDPLPSRPRRVEIPSNSVVLFPKDGRHQGYDMRTKTFQVYGPFCEIGERGDCDCLGCCDYAFNRWMRPIELDHGYTVLLPITWLPRQSDEEQDSPADASTDAISPLIPASSQTQEYWEKNLYVHGMALLKDGKRLTQVSISKKIGKSLTDLKQYLKPYPKLWLSVKHRVLEDYKQKDS